MNLQFDEADIMERNEWVMFLRAKKLPGYLTYPGSQLSPLTEVKASFWNMNNPGSKTYEDFWYHTGVPVGMRRYNQLSLRPRATGAIFVQSSPDATIETRALANSILRLTLDLTVVNIAPAAVIVPQEIYPQVLADLSYFGFHQRNGGQLSETPQASIHLVSNPTVYDLFLYYSK